MNTSRNMIFGVIYRVPNTNIPKFIELISTVLAYIKKENKFCYFLGDYNLDLLNSNTHSHTGLFWICSQAIRFFHLSIDPPE